MSSLRSVYQKELVPLLKELYCLKGVAGLLDWDQNVMMPAGASEIRGQQMAALAGIIHEKQTSVDLGNLLKKLDSWKSDSALNDYEKAVIRDTIRAYRREVNVPKNLAQKLAELSTRGYTVWVDARENKDFKKFAPILQEWIDLLREKCRYIDPAKPAYEVLLDDYERGMPIETLDQLFEKLKRGLTPLIRRIQEKGQPDEGFLKGLTFPIDDQKSLNARIAKDLGFDFNCGRLDVSVHPFTGGADPTDVRMTTRYKDSEIIEGITGTIHETGHSIYEQGRNKEYAGLPVSEAMSMGLHESQSLLYERMVGLSRPFWDHYWPIVKDHFKQIPGTTSVDQFYRVLNKSEPGFIRVEADEVTYPLHIIIRYELERGLFDGSVKVEELPERWNAKMKEYLGIVPPDDKLGVLQDTHWSVGLFGYFPTYTLGAIYACQIFKQAEKVIPDLNKKMAAGQFEELKRWLNSNIHEKGSLQGSGDLLIREVTGEPLNADLFVQYLTAKYSGLYGL